MKFVKGVESTYVPALAAFVVVCSRCGEELADDVADNAGAARIARAHVCAITEESTTMNKIVNATPHQLDVRRADGEFEQIPPTMRETRRAVECPECRGAQGPCGPTLDTDGVVRDHTCPACGGQGQVTETGPEAPYPVCCAEQREAAGEVSGVALSRATFGEIDGLAYYAARVLQPGDALVVSALAANAIAAAVARGGFAGVPDGVRICCPGPALRDAAGRVIGCDGLTVVAEVQQRSPLLRRLVGPAS